MGAIAHIVDRTTIRIHRFRRISQVMVSGSKVARKQPLSSGGHMAKRSRASCVSGLVRFASRKLRCHQTLCYAAYPYDSRGIAW